MPIKVPIVDDSAKITDEEGGRSEINGRRCSIPRPTNPMVSPLLTDLYQFSMAYAYWKAGKHLDHGV